MPEGDTIHTLARELARELAGQRLAELHVRRHGARPELAGQTIGRPTARGKHLLVPLGDRVVLRVHLGMYGGWDRFAIRSGWRGRVATHEVVVATDQVAFACRRPLAAELVRAEVLSSHPILARLGPDLLTPPVDWAEVLERARRRGRKERRIRELLLDQTVACGIGNIFKCETLFVERVHPDTDVRSLDDPALLGLYRRASLLMRANVAAVPRLLTALDPASGAERGHRAAGGGDNVTWVYGRAGRPCRRCSTPIRFADEGGDDRITWWCPTCQPNPGRRAAARHTVPTAAQESESIES